MKTAIEQGVKGGIDQSTMAEMIRRVVEAIREQGGEPGGLAARVEALEAKTVTHNVDLQRHEARLERHRLRIRWLERWAHIHWPAWLPRPGL